MSSYFSVTNLNVYFALKGTELPLEIFGWEDSGSLISGYNFKLYQLEYDAGQGDLIQNEVLVERQWQITDDPPVLEVVNPGKIVSGIMFEFK